VGHNSDEGLLFTTPFVETQFEFVEYLSELFPDATEDTINYISETLYPPVFNTPLYSNQVERTALLLSEAIFTCNTRYFDLAFNNQTYSYYFSVPPGIHGTDVAYTYFNGDETTPDLLFFSPVNATIATVMQKYLTNFAMTGDPNGEGVPEFPTYGPESMVVNLNVTGLGETLTDTVANERCIYWQKALYT